MKKFLPLVIIILTLGVIVFGLYFLAKKNETGQNLGPATAYEYYWGAGCPHCAVVADFLDTWDGRDKVKIDKYEVWNNQTNFKRMQARAQECKLDKNNLGVPMLYT
ncbi:MAG: hypothetical protein AAB546_01920, partial [Patescibacteria group bacterium]